MSQTATFPSLVARQNNGNGVVPSALIEQLNANGATDLKKVGITIVAFVALALVTVIAFQILRPNNKIVYAPKYKYAEEGKAPPKASEGFFGWLPPIIKYKEHDLLPLIGLDGVTFLRFIRMMRWMLTTLAILMSVVLMPVDIAYNMRNGGSNLVTNKLNYLNMSNVHGNYMWAHVGMSYVGTIVALAFIWYHYREMVRLRWAYFRSEEYQTSFHARTLMITDVTKRYQADNALGAVLSELKMPYPTTEVHIGRRVGILPDLIEKHNDLVRELERVLAKYLKNPNQVPAKRPTKTIGGFMGCGGKKVDAIDYLTSQINRVEAAVMHQRDTIQDKQPEMYGFASLAAVPYAHAAAKVLQGKRPGGMRVTLAPPPTGIIWKNLTRSRASRAKSSFFGFLMLLVLFFLNIFPLIIVSLLSNMAGLTTISWLGWLKDWQSSSSFTFAAVSGLGAPIIMGIASFFFPLAMRRIAKYRGIQTRYRLDRLLVGQYFGFLVISQFLFFSLIGVILSLVSQLVVEINKDSALNIIERLGRTAAYAAKQQYLNQSNYWLTWLPLRGYLAVFDLAQVIKLMLVWVQKVFFGRTPRDVREYTKPPVFDYWMYYANFLFMAAVAMIYAPLAPLVIVFSAVVFWANSFIYKYQLMYVFVTKHETGGMLWRPAINRLLVCIGFMQVILILAVVLDTLNYYQAIAALPPILMLVGFKIYCRTTFDRRFDWYIPNEAEIAASKIHGGDARHNRLQRRFGHPTLHSKLFTPMVHAKVKHLLPQVYKGRIDQGVAVVDGRKVETEQVAGGLKIAAIEEDQLEYDPRKDSDNRSVMSGTTLGGMSMAGIGATSPDDLAETRANYFKDQYANYMAGGNTHGGEEFEMANVSARDSRDNLLEKRQHSLYNESLDGTLAGTTYGGKSSPEGVGAHGAYNSYSANTTPAFEGGMPQQARYVDPYAQIGQSQLPRMGANHSAQGSQTSLGSYGNLLYGSTNPAVAAATAAAATPARGYGPPASQAPSYGGSTMGRTPSPGQPQQISPGTVIAPMATSTPQYHAGGGGGYTASPPNYQQPQRFMGAPPSRQASADYPYHPSGGYGQQQQSPQHAPVYAHQQQAASQPGQPYAHGQQSSGGNYYPSQHGSHGGSGYQQGGPHGYQR
ncbi:protein of unknown function DUF4463 [Kalmanozyma brasiliensis GHG001]|uniref:DUF221-domain-containing protein n=1 Tax=Kalmanozyma brasiliensis (strain GHG001) TaxID=1365824 RepID=V5ENF8_KALBG|nr:protein of unknown function DUF4463 [Kalmanozyma brasiliensis GHG001]EST04468.1 protein of unknown function DUF4463 [Kalmanozyma brasiliensis GHG001]